MANKELVVFGAGGHAVAVADVVLDNDPGAKLIFVDPGASPEAKITIEGKVFDVLPEIEATSDREYFIAIGDNQKRQAINESLGSVALTRVISQRAVIRLGVEISNGCFIGHQAFIGPLARIGEGSIVNTRSLVSHEVEVGQYSFLALDVIICGRTKIGDNVSIGTRATILDRHRICSNVIIGAESLVTKDIDLPGTYVGRPARLVE